MQIPDLLNSAPYLAIDGQTLEQQIGLAYLGRELGTQIHDTIARSELTPSQWKGEFFATDLFVGDLVRKSFRLEIDGRTYPVNHEFLERCIANTPTDTETIELRQGVLRELDDNPDLCAAAYELYQGLFDLLSLLKTPGYQSQLDQSAFHLDFLHQAKHVIDFMQDRFGDAKSALRRLHEAAVENQQGDAYKKLAALLEYESGMASLTLDVTIGGDGKIRRLQVERLDEKRDNPFYVKPLRRFLNRWGLAFRGYRMSNRELLNRTINHVFETLSPHLVPLVQVLGQLEFYLTARDFRDRAESAGLEVCLADFGEDHCLKLDDLFNPLLLGDSASPPVACSIAATSPTAITLITGPNSGGKTRLLQALGLGQLLGQSGLYVAARSAKLRVAGGLFVSLIEEENSEQTEGRLGRELLRIRALFEDMAPHSMVILDELCSGTNPSEGQEVFTMVLQLLDQVDPVAFVTTHFLDFARSLESKPLVRNLQFRQVHLDDDLISTYQFVDGVAPTSLAALTAKRLGVTFERLSQMVRDPTAKTEAEAVLPTERVASFPR